MGREVEGGGAISLIKFAGHQPASGNSNNHCPNPCKSPATSGARRYLSNAGM